MIKIETIDDLYSNLNKLPSIVVQDIDRRITDWLASGGKNTDAYIKQQFRYAENVMNSR